MGSAPEIGQVYGPNGGCGNGCSDQCWILTSVPMKRLLLPLAFALLLPPAAQAEAYKLRLSGDWWASSYTFLVVDVQGQTVKPRFVDHNNAFGTFKPASSKWFDYPATAVRACPVGSGSWGATDGCLVSEGSSITMPEGADLDDYRFDFKYKKNEAIVEYSFNFKDLKGKAERKKERREWKRDR